MYKIGKLRISAVRNESFNDIRYAKANIGECIQSVAMQSLYDRCGVNRSRIVRIDQCDIKKYSGEEIVIPLRLPLCRDNVDSFFPLEPCVHPFFISLHLHDDIFENRADLTDYFRNYEPIGCRDEISCGYFRKHGIESYIMGCYTLVFPQRDLEKTRKKVFLTDASQTLLESIPQDILLNAETVSHAVPYMKYPVTPEEDSRLEGLAEKYLERYRDEAALVITSRIHAAAPCTAMGVPVILATDNADFRYAWIDRFLPIYQSDEYSSIKWDASVVDVSFIRECLADLFDGILNRKEMRTATLRSMDLFYRSRNKTEYYKNFKARLNTLKDTYKRKPFSYMIWGAGNHSLFAYQLMSEMYPEARLVVVIDRFKKGSLFGVPIVHPDEAPRYTPDHICITTKPGTEEAISGCKMIFGESYRSHYTLITSQQES